MAYFLGDPELFAAVVYRLSKKSLPEWKSQAFLPDLRLSPWISPLLFFHQLPLPQVNMFLPFNSSTCFQFKTYCLYMIQLPIIWQLSCSPGLNIITSHLQPSDPQMKYMQLEVQAHNQFFCVNEEFNPGVRLLQSEAFISVCSKLGNHFENC